MGVCCLLVWAIDLCEGLNNQVKALALGINVVYVGGMFTNAGGSGANYIAVYNMTSNTFSPLGVGLCSLRCCCCCCCCCCFEINPCSSK